MVKDIKNFIYPPCEDYYFHQFLGLPRNGKTLWIVEKYLLPALLAGEQVWSSEWINWKGDNLHFFNNFEQVLPVRNATVFFGEIGRYLNARDFENESTELKMWFAMHGHYRNNILGDCQDVSQIAKSARIHISRWFVMEKMALHNWFGCIAVQQIETTLRNINMREKGLFVGCEYDDDGEIIREDGDKEIIKRFITTRKSLIHHELDHRKELLECFYCPHCGGNYLYEGVCPRHNTLNLIVPTPMYDTHIDPPLPDDPDVVWVAMKKYPKLQRYKGACQKPSNLV